MDVPIVMPQLGVDIEEAQIDEWLKAEGDAVEEGEQVVIVTTPKVTLELEAPASGGPRSTRSRRPWTCATAATPDLGHF